MDAMVPLSIRAMSVETEPDCRALWSQPPEGWCWCVAWEVPSWEGWTERTAEENRRLREELWRRGEHYGYVFYLGGEPMGWCRVGPVGVWPKLASSRGLRPDEGTFAFTCFGIRPPHRRKGLLERALRLVIADLRERGVKRLVAVPKKVAGEVEDGELWNGPKSLFDRLGFWPVRETDTFWEMHLDLA